VSPYVRQDTLLFIVSTIDMIFTPNKSCSAI
jgi:hypothetical protein